MPHLDAAVLTGCPRGYLQWEIGMVGLPHICRDRLAAPHY